ncbi:MAG: hypothetical protein C00003105_01075 [ANME-2 cluster archaeon HR1]|nr:MAG: hypothetical protein C00003105_01075 [ANME-2 cluster archaeon HR1]
MNNKFVLCSIQLNNFIVLDSRKRIKFVIQVCFELSEHNRKREVDGLVSAMNDFDLNMGMILTYDQEEKIEIGSKTIIVKPVWKWLLESEQKHNNY